MNSLTLLIIALCTFALAYRYYGAFLAAKVAVLDPKKATPAFEFRDGKDYHPTNKWVLFGHHFAAIAGAGPLVGPVLAAQYGYMPGVLWILIGAIFAGAVQDYIILYASVRNKGESISKIAERHLGPVAGWCTAFAVLFIIIVALAGLAMVVVNALHESAWGVFTIACSVPIAFLMGQWMYKIRPGKVAEASVIGVVLLLIGVLAGHPVSQSHIASWFSLSKETLEVALPTYGFIAAILPVWMLLCPRDYLSTYMKLGTVALLAIGILFVHPSLVMPATTKYIHGGGPIIPGPVWPYVCLTIACGAISGFHALIGSGTTPKMISNEADIKPIGYGAMLVEGFVGLLALVAACTLPQAHYFAINADPAKFPLAQGVASQVGAIAREVGEKTLIGRTGGSVTLAVGMAKIFDNLPGMKGMMSYWYHFAIMFEALFILTTIDTGTRVARFIVQEMLRPVYKPLGKGTWLPGVIVTSFAVTYSWFYLLRGGTVNSIWPMFGIANQLLGVIALAIGTTLIIRKSAKRVYALTTFIPFVFMAVTVITSGAQYTGKQLGDAGTLATVVATQQGPALTQVAEKLPTYKLGTDPAKAITQAKGRMQVNAFLTIVMMLLTTIICLDCTNKWIRTLCCPTRPSGETDPDRDLMGLAEGTEIKE
ncbi:carbon starvation protein A [bacterium]|nr:carbon starvation protein A [bacterium]